MVDEVLTLADLREYLQQSADEKNAAFSAKLAPGVDTSRFLGVRVPLLRALVKNVRKQGEQGTALVQSFLADVPHTYIEEDELHMMFLNELRDVDQFVAGLEAFFPYVDNWMVSDACGPKFRGEKLIQLEPHLQRWLTSADTYVARCGALILMQDYLGDRFRKEHLMWVATMPSDDYYAHMMIGWYFATALAKQPDETWPVFVDPAAAKVPIPSRARKMAIQKSIESRRIPEDRKEALRAIRTTLKKK
ncbi:MAG: DNA alkylation repair protein [Actinomycetaceae bacterium]|nr:DNA alkylation repair protein [Actinomycetaceae bacterium]